MAASDCRRRLTYRFRLIFANRRVLLLGAAKTVEIAHGRMLVGRDGGQGGMDTGVKRRREVELLKRRMRR